MKLFRPEGLILDFGGVIVEASKVSGWEKKVADFLEPMLGSKIPRDRLESDILAGETAAKLWRNAMSRPMYPRELNHKEYVLDLIGADWGEESRKILEKNASEICYKITYFAQDRELRNGTRELLEWCKKEQIPVGIGSNALCGDMHRDCLKDHNLSEFFSVEIYSNEVEIRKPNPNLIKIVADKMGVDIKKCWYVGDHYDRDVLCARRAGAGVAVLMTTKEPEKRPFSVFANPDLIVADPADLLKSLKEI